MAATAPTTAGEILFEDYLRQMQYPYEFEKEFPGKSKRPDYTVTRDGHTFLFDVKDFIENMPLGASCYDPYPRIREKIDEGREKFKQFKEFPCAVVLQNNGNIFVHLDRPHVVLGAMYGDAGFKVPVWVGNGAPPTEQPPVTQAFLGRGKMVRGSVQQNTTISALITLRKVGVGWLRYKKMVKEFPKLSIDETIQAASERYDNFDLNEEHLGVIVWENAVARIPLSRTLFTGDYDLRWGVEGQDQTVTFEGKHLAGLE
ncbi:MAG: hypothetical protein WB543_06190 [Candidatus Acidiferrum sp.]